MYTNYYNQAVVGKAKSKAKVAYKMIQNSCTCKGQKVVVLFRGGRAFRLINKAQLIFS